MATKKVPILEEFVWQPPVKDKDFSSPPVSPSPVKGDRYIVAATGSGDWFAHTGDIADYNGSDWLFVIKIEGLITWVKDENVFYKYDGTNWSQELMGAQTLNIDGGVEPGPNYGGISPIDCGGI